MSLYVCVDTLIQKENSPDCLKLNSLTNYITINWQLSGFLGFAGTQNCRREMLQTTMEQCTALDNMLLPDLLFKQTPGLPETETEKWLTKSKKSHISSA